MVQRKPKKKKNRENLPEGMSRREAKLAARAKEREQRIYISSPVERQVHMHGAIF